MSKSISKPISGGPLFSLNDGQAQKIKSKCGRFRILIIGRANAGKTTILQKVCNTTEDPIVYDANGEEIDPLVLEASASRGLHNIEEELVFKSNPGFIFHDSRGFEAGGIEELNKVKEFIESRSKETKLARKLHAIWYCIPVDDSRPFTTAENWFFSECGTADVPVIAIFTKFDALDTKAFTALRKGGKSTTEAEELAPQHAVASFEVVHLKTVYTLAYPPKDHVYQRNMNTEGPDCSELVERTAAVLDNETLQQLFVSTQRNSLKLCIRYGLERSPLIGRSIDRLIQTIWAEEMKRMIYGILVWFPHYVPYFDRDDRDRLHTFDDLRHTVDIVYSRLFSKSKNLNSLQGLIQSAITITILGDFGFLLWQDCKVDPLKAIDIYERCPSIRDAISQATDQALKTYFDHAQEDDGATKQLREEIVQIAFDNRLPTELLKDPIITGKKESSEDRKRDGFIKRLFSKRL